MREVGQHYELEEHRLQNLFIKHLLVGFEPLERKRVLHNISCNLATFNLCAQDAAMIIIQILDTLYDDILSNGDTFKCL